MQQRRHESSQYLEVVDAARAVGLTPGRARREAVLYHERNPQSGLVRVLPGNRVQIDRHRVSELYGRVPISA